MRVVVLVASLFTCGMVHAQPEEQLCVIATDRGCVGPICGLHPRAVTDRDHALILEQSLTEENYRENLQILERDAQTRDRRPSDFEMAVVAARRQKRAYELQVRYEQERSESTRQEFCQWLHEEGYFPE